MITININYEQYPPLMLAGQVEQSAERTLINMCSTFFIFYEITKKHNSFPALPQMHTKEEGKRTSGVIFYTKAVRVTIIN